MLVQLRRWPYSRWLQVHMECIVMEYVHELWDKGGFQFGDNICLHSFADSEVVASFF